MAKKKKEIRTNNEEKKTLHKKIKIEQLESY
jgi:hypothetical protein